MTKKPAKPKAGGKPAKTKKPKKKKSSSSEGKLEQQHSPVKLTGLCYSSPGLRERRVG